MASSNRTGGAPGDGPGGSGENAGSEEPGQNRRPKREGDQLPSSATPTLKNVKLPLVEVPLVGILALCTTINIVLIIGGTLFGSYKVDSIQQKYDQAQERITRATAMYQETERRFSDQQRSAQGAIDLADKLTARVAKVDESLQVVLDAGKSAQSQLRQSVDSNMSSLETKFSEGLQDIDTREQAARADLRSKRENLLNEVGNDEADTKIKLAELRADAKALTQDAKQFRDLTAGELDQVRAAHEVGPEIVWRNSTLVLRLTAIGVLLGTVVISALVAWLVARRR